MSRSQLIASIEDRRLQELLKSIQEEDRDSAPSRRLVSEAAESRANVDRIDEPDAVVSSAEGMNTVVPPSSDY